MNFKYTLGKYVDTLEVAERAPHCSWLYTNAKWLEMNIGLYICSAASLVNKLIILWVTRKLVM